MFFFILNEIKINKIDFYRFQDYENDSHGKDIILQRTSIKIPGSNKPRIGLRCSNNDNKLNELTTTDSQSNTMGKNNLSVLFVFNEFIFRQS